MDHKSKKILILIEPERRLNQHFSKLRSYLGQEGIPFQQAIGFDDPVLQKLNPQTLQDSSLTYLLVINNACRDLSIPRRLYFGGPSVKIFCFPNENKCINKIKILKKVEDVKNAFLGTLTTKQIWLKSIKRVD